jgi:hypothetical protein
MTAIVPTVGRIVLYRLSQFDCDEINRLHGRRGGCPSSYDVLPAIVTKVWGHTADAAVNLKVMLDGPAEYWATSRMHHETAAGCYHWMPYQKGQAAKTEAAEKALGASAVYVGGNPNVDARDPSHEQS